MKNIIDAFDLLTQIDRLLYGWKDGKRICRTNSKSHTATILYSTSNILRHRHVSSIEYDWIYVYRQQQLRLSSADTENTNQVASSQRCRKALLVQRYGRINNYLLLFRPPSTLINSTKLFETGNWYTEDHFTWFQNIKNRIIPWTERCLIKVKEVNRKKKQHSHIKDILMAIN